MNSASSKTPGKHGRLSGKKNLGRNWGKIFSVISVWIPRGSSMSKGTPFELLQNLCTFFSIFFDKISGENDHPKWIQRHRKRQENMVACLGKNILGRNWGKIFSVTSVWIPRGSSMSKGTPLNFCKIYAHFFRFFSTNFLVKMTILNEFSVIGNARKTIIKFGTVLCLMGFGEVNSHQTEGWVFGYYYLIYISAYYC